MRVTRVFTENLKSYKKGYRVIINKGGSRSSKSWSIIQLLHIISQESSRHIKTSLVSQSFPHLSDGIIYDYTTMLQNEGFDPNIFHNRSGHYFKLNKSIMNYFSADDTGKVMGPARDLLFLNEPNKGISFDIYNQLKTRTKETIWVDYNPSNKFWLHNEGIIDDSRSIVIHSNWLDNYKNLTKHQIQDFIDIKKKAKTSDYWNYYYKVYVLGEDALLLEERIMPILKWVKKVPDDAIEIPSGIDFGFADPTVFLRMWIKKNDLKDDLYIQEIVHDSKLSINTKSEGQQNLIEILDQKGINKNSLTIAESAEPRSITEMRNAGYNIEAVKKTAVENSIRVFHDYNIHFVEGSDKSYNEFDSYKYKRDHKTNEIMPIPEKDQDDHSCDACRYVLLSRNYRWSV